MDEIFSRECLLRAIKSKYEIIAIWGAYQIMRLPSDKIGDYLSLFLESPFLNIQDAGIAKIAEIGAEEYVTEILKIFRETEGQIKYSAAFTLSQFPNDFSKSLIQKWFEQLSTTDQFTRMEFETAAYAYLQIDRESNFAKALKLLQLSQQDAIKSSVLLVNLLSVCESKIEFKAIFDQYFVLRDLNSDAELSFQLIEYFGLLELTDWWSNNLAKGYSVSSIYGQCYALLGLQININDRQFWSEIERSFGVYDRLHPGAPHDHELFIQKLQRWVAQLLEKTNVDMKLGRLKWIMEAYDKNKSVFLKTIPKILEMECHFLLSIPLFIIIEQSITSWLQKPVENLENIANYYHSSLLIKEYREEILGMFFPQLPEWTKEKTKIRHDHSPLTPENTKSEILWLFNREELLGYDIPWPSIFPNPDFSIHLADGLFNIYFHNFSYYIQKKDQVAVDYALQLFQLKPDKRIIDLLLEHFDFLSHHHTDILYQTIEYLPDPAFLNLLLAQYQSEEYDTARLIFVISEIFNHSVPEKIRRDLQHLHDTNFQNSAIKKPIRLHCQVCDNAFQYTVDEIYVDEGSILRINKMSADSVWVPQEFFCKECSAPVPFILDDNQLNEFSLQSRINRILKITPQSKGNQLGLKIILIDFPRHGGVTYSPAKFDGFVSELERNADRNENEMRIVWMKQVRLHKAMMDWEFCREVLEKIEPARSYEDEWMFLMGLANYKLSSFADSRKHFDLIVEKYSELSPQIPSSTYLEQAKYFLMTMDSDVSKRMRFKVITRKK